MKNEKTSKQVSKIASKALRMVEVSKENRSPNDDQVVWANIAGTLKIDEVAALAASCLTQVADKPKRKRTKNVKKRSK